MLQKKECNDVQCHIQMFANSIGSQNWWGPVHINQEIDIMKVGIVPYISLEYIVFSFSSKPRDDYRNYNYPWEQFVMYFSVEYLH